MYKVKIYKGNYGERQRAANSDRAICYYEQHFNASPSASAGYTCCLVAHNASNTSKEWARLYSQGVSMSFDTKDKGVIQTKKGGRGDYNIRLTSMPSILAEPLFVSNEDHVKAILEANGVERLADIAVKSIKAMFPNGGLVALSIGHKYKTSAPRDRGAAVVGHPNLSEAYLAEQVINRMKEMLEGFEEEEKSDTIKVIKNGAEVFWTKVKESAKVVYSRERKTLEIDE